MNAEITVYPSDCSRKGVSSCCSLLITLGIRRSCPTDAEPVEMQPVSDHILLWLEEDNVHFGGKQTSQDNKAAQAYRNAHSCSLNLHGERYRNPQF